MNYPDYIAGALLIIGLLTMLSPLASGLEFQIEDFLRRHVRHKEIGWSDIGEIFTRYALFKSRWFNVYVHQLYAPNWHPECHDHPWGFLTVLLWRGYVERIPVEDDCVCGIPRTVTRDVRRYPGQILWRPATFTHSVTTPRGTSWSLIFTGPKVNDWGFRPCNRPTAPTKSYARYVKEQSGVL